MPNYAEIADKSMRLILLFLRNFSLNIYRRGLILWKYLGIWWQKCRMAKQYRRLGKSVYAKLTAGDVNPLLQDEVKDQLNTLQALEENILGRKEAIAGIREQIKATSYRLPPRPAAAGQEAKPEAPVD